MRVRERTGADSDETSWAGLAVMRLIGIGKRVGAREKPEG